MVNLRYDALVDQEEKNKELNKINKIENEIKAEDKEKEKAEF